MIKKVAVPIMAAVMTVRCRWREAFRRPRRPRAERPRPDTAIPPVPHSQAERNDIEAISSRIPIPKKTAAAGIKPATLAIIKSSANPLHTVARRKTRRPCACCVVKSTSFSVTPASCSRGLSCFKCLSPHQMEISAAMSEIRKPMTRLRGRTSSRKFRVPMAPTHQWVSP